MDFSKMETNIRGTGVSPGIALAKAYILRREKLVIPDASLTPSEETLRFHNAAALVAKQTKLLYENMAHLDEESAEILDAQLTIIEDREGFVKPVEQRIAQEGVNAEKAVAQHMDELTVMFEEMDDPYMRERGADIKDIKNRLLRVLLGVHDAELTSLPGPVIIVADELTTSDTAKWDGERVEGIITRLGGVTSHMAIIAKNLGIPAIVGASGLPEDIRSADIIVMDGDSGEFVISPSEETQKMFLARDNARKEQAALFETLRGKPSQTADGQGVILKANIGGVSEALHALQWDAEGVGLFRSELLYTQRRSLPGEDEQFECYRQVLEIMGEKPVTIRTLDIGGDKRLPYLDIPNEDNPFLGYRAIRLCLDRVDIFKTQLRALLRAGVYGNLHIMFPMISAVEELEQARAVVEEAKEELRVRSVAFNGAVPIGIMVETPAAAILSDHLASNADFFSIGTNDLIQYTAAVDRGNDRISHLYSFYNPAVLRLINSVIKAAKSTGIKCGMCGEAAADPLLVPALVGMGLNEFSMSAPSILSTRMLMSGLNVKVCRALADETLCLPTAESVLEALCRFAKENNVCV